MRPWIKLHTIKLDDVRLLRLPERQQLRYYQMYLLAGRLNADGSFVENGQQLSESDIAIKLRISDAKQFTTDVKALKSAGLLKANGHGPFIADFAHEQVDWSKKQEQERERKARQRGHENVTRDKNVTEKKSRARHGNVTPLEEDQNQTKKKIKKEKKNPPTPTPSSKRKPAAAGGGGSTSTSTSSSSASDWMKNLNQHEKQIAQIMQPILRSFGLGQPKIENLIPKVATRISPADAKRITLAALASVCADDDVRKKPIVAAYRIEHNEVPALFANPHTWKVIPEDVLKVAGVEIEQPHSPGSNNDAVRKAVDRVLAR